MKKSFDVFIEEATKRIRVLNTAHYTSASNKANILKSGFRDSPSTGAYHPDTNKRTVYTSPHASVGKTYGHSRVNIRIVNPKVKNTNSFKNYKNQIKDIVMNRDGEDLQNKARQISPVQQSKRNIEAGHSIVRVPDAHSQFNPKSRRTSYIMIDKDVANKNINRNPVNPTIRKKK